MRAQKESVRAVWIGKAGNILSKYQF
ncbi:hypothetical protein NITLEN_10341 [Nitrospira lenta]|uniref:Uncharacterized protein n=1 Tax=Nitrospira lenta TaxID=1436998 RepID=A0A330L0G6_9BACT|nr:hypothetical protein NITLEN_10341 [Nitrospira lenta]